MEAARSSETSVSYHNPEDMDLSLRRREDVASR
jgi:hypothetical protein